MVEEEFGSIFMQSIENQVREWHLARQKNKSRSDIVVTVSREPGSGGEEIARKLSEALGWEFYNKQIADEIVTKANVDKGAIHTHDEKAPSDFYDWLSDFMGSGSVSSDIYLKGLKSVIAAVAEQGGAVILGRGANFMIPHDRSVSIRLIAPMSYRVKAIMAKLGTTEKAAKEFIAKREEAQRKFVGKYFNADVSDPNLYDAIFNTALVDKDTIVKEIKEMVDARSSERLAETVIVQL